MISLSSRRVLRVAVVALAFPVVARAHPSHGFDGFAAGFVHPLTGWDHLVAAVATGIWAAQLGGRARWAMPALFAGAVAMGLAFGFSNMVSPAAELGVAASGIILGLVILGAVRLPAYGAACVVGTIALWHGMVHGAEAVAVHHRLSYAAGLTLTTAALAAGGSLCGLAAKRRLNLRFAGALIAAVGAALWA